MRNVECGMEARPSGSTRVHQFRVPNFSEGRNAATIEALRLALTSVPGVRLLDVQSDAAHNRSVFTFVAPPDPSVEAALAAMRVATERIDLSHHTGVPPRLGATDVVPFVPVRDATMDDCVARALACRTRGCRAPGPHLPVRQGGHAPRARAP